MALEQRCSYDGPVEVFILHGEKICDTEAHLNGYVEVVEVRTFGGTNAVDGVTSWDGWLELSDHQQLDLIGKQLELKLDNGNTARAVLRGLNQGIQGVRETPF